MNKIFAGNSLAQERFVAGFKDAGEFRGIYAGSASRPTADSAAKWDLGLVVRELHGVRERWRQSQRRNPNFTAREFPSLEVLEQVCQSLRAVLFPMRLGSPERHRDGEDFYVHQTLETALNALCEQVRIELAYKRRLRGEDRSGIEPQADGIIRDFARQLPSLRVLLDTDIEAAYLGDPAARSVDEVLLCYPGILAVIHYRLAHALHQLGVPLVARIIAEIAHSATGIDIHPGASIGEGFFIDHGTGVVIGETTVIGKRVRLYQAVTLGAKRFTVDESGALEKGAPRHPILEDDVVVYAGASILGRITIGRGSSIGGNVWLTKSVPPGSQISQASVQQESGSSGKPGQ